MAVRVLLADYHRLVLDGLRALVDREPDMEVIAEAQDGRTAVRLALEMSPDVVIINPSMPILNGIDATRQIVNESPGVKTIGLASYPNREAVAGILAAGASGCLCRDSPFDEVARAIRSVAANHRYLGPTLVGLVIEDYVRRLPTDDRWPSAILTPREREVLQLLVEGETTRQIASRLVLSIKTIETHRRRIMTRLGIHSVAGLTKYAIREGLTSLEF